MTPNIPTLDYGEPWHNNGFGFISSLNGSDQFFCEAFRESCASRIIACVNACAGMVDPAKEIKAMREAISEAHEAINEAQMTIFEEMNSWRAVDINLPKCKAALTKLQPYTTHDT